jgi:hypothetical protein
MITSRFMLPLRWLGGNSLNDWMNLPAMACAAATTMLAKKNAIAMTLGRYVLLMVGPPAGVRP